VKSWMNAQCSTASALAASAVRTENVLREPRMGVAPRAFSFASPLSLRERPVTVWPFLMANSVQALPM